MGSEWIEKTYVSRDPADSVQPADSRSRTVVKRIGGVEVSRTYYVYLPCTNVIDRAAVQGAQPTGLAPHVPACTHTADFRGNVTESWGGGRVRLDCHSRSCLWYNSQHEKLPRQSSQPVLPPD